MRKHVSYILILIALVGILTPVDLVQAQANSSTNENYNLLAPLPCTGTEAEGCIEEELRSFDPTGTGGGALGGYLNLMLKLFIGIAAVLAVIMLVMGGIQYMTSELAHSKEAGKERMRNAIFGLLLALGAYTLLFTINPDLLKTDLSSLTDATISITSNSAIIKTGGNCTIPTGGACSPGNLSIFGAQAENASKICNIESGGRANAISGGDRCRGGGVFSLGLFQINILANGRFVKDANGNSCTGLFEKMDGTPIDKDYIKRKPDGSFDYYDCKVKSGQENRLGECSMALLNPAENIRVAKALFDQNSRPFGDWYYSDRGVCGEGVFQ